MLIIAKLIKGGPLKKESQLERQWKFDNVAEVRDKMKKVF